MYQHICSASCYAIHCFDSNMREVKPAYRNASHFNAALKNGTSFVSEYNKENMATARALIGTAYSLLVWP